MTEFKELGQNFTADGLEENETKGQSIFSYSTKALRRLTARLTTPSAVDCANEERPDTQTDYDDERSFVNDDNFDPEEALDAAILIKENY